nr:M20/M25/M40 family metallo-hydrolase [Actinomycetota bacterium]
HDPAYVASKLTVFLRDLADRYGGHQVCTVGKIDLFPNLVNVVPARAVLTLDIRNTDEALLAKAEAEVATFISELAADEGVSISSRVLARFEPVQFDESVIAMIETIADNQGNTVRRMPSGAGHDAQMLARVCPAAMIFVPSVKGISHNPAEYTDPIDLEAGANILLHTMLQLTELQEF